MVDSNFFFCRNVHLSDVFSHLVKLSTSPGFKHMSSVGVEISWRETGSRSQAGIVLTVCAFSN